MAAAVAWETTEEWLPDWEEVKGEDGSVYYWNTITDETRWEAPVVKTKVLVRTPGAPASPDAGGTPQKMWTPDTRSFLNWKAEDPASAKAAETVKGAAPASPEAKLENDLLAMRAGLNTTGKVDARGKFIRVGNDEVEEEMIRARGRARRAENIQSPLARLLRALLACCGSVGSAGQACCGAMVGGAGRSGLLLRVSAKLQDGFRSDAQASHREHRALTIDALSKYKAAKAAEDTQEQSYLTPDQLAAIAKGQSPTAVLDRPRSPPPSAYM